MVEEAKKKIKIGNVTFRFFGTGYQGRLLLSTYPSGNSKMNLDVKDMHKNWVEFAEVSADLSELDIPKRLFPFRNYGPLVGLLDCLEGQGLKRIGKSVTVNGREYPIVHWATSIERKTQR